MKFIKLLFTFLLVCSCVACTKEEVTPYQQIPITTSELKEKLENKETFNFMVIRENCDHCEALERYIDITEQENPNIVLYTLDSTDFDFYRDNPDDLLSARTDEGTYLLTICPYFLYTPSIYIIEDGEIVTTGIGFNDLNKCISVWDNESLVDFDTAQEIEFWQFIS